MKQKVVIHIGTLHAKPEYADDLINSLEALKQSPGYISHECYRDIEDENKFTLVERWQSKQDHENFVKSFSPEAMEQWLNMVADVGDDSYFQEVVS